MSGRTNTVTIENAKTVVSWPQSEPPRSDGVIPQIDGYEIHHELGRGGMGVVYKATQSSLGRAVAIKMILSGNADPEERARFVKEAEAVARFQHPNIVQIYEVGEADGRPFFSLEYVEGGNLEEKLDKKPLAWKPAAQMLTILARAIHAAHERGIVHRDLKPANILISADGRPKITDFGIAKRLDAADQTQIGKIMGTPCYMSPEQATGRTDKVGPGTDIYALGAILYDALTGRPPFEADNTLDTLMQAITRDPVAPRILQPAVPRDLNIICLKCLEKSAEKRYSSARELAKDLDRLLQGRPIHARPISKWEWVQRWAHRHPAWSAILVLSALSLAGLTAAGAWFTNQLQSELKATEAARNDTMLAQKELRKKLIKGTANAIDSDLKQLAGVPRVIAAALETRTDWTEAQLTAWLQAELNAESHIFGMAVAFEPNEFEEDKENFCLYVFRGNDGLEEKQLLPPDYMPIYREWDWYTKVASHGTWSEPYVDEGGGDIPMVTYSMPFRRKGKKAGVITVDLSLQYFEDLNRSMQASNFGGASYILVMTPRGTIVSHPNTAFRFPASQAILSSQDKQESWARALAGEEGSAFGREPVTGKPAELLFAPVITAHWSAVAIIPQ